LGELVGAGTLMAVDFGTVRIGVAACDAGRVLAYPLAVVPAGPDALDRLVELAEDVGAVTVIVGYPVQLDGRPGPAAAAVAGQAAALAARLTQPVRLVDERLTTAAAHRRLRETGRTARTARAIVDAQAAVGILETVLDALRQGNLPGRTLEME